MLRLNILLLFFLYVQIGHAQDYTYEEVVSRENAISRQNSNWAMERPYLVLISIDGFRYDYAVKFNAANILKIQKEGVYSKRLIPSFPSKTFPNHYSIVTGMYPGRHGIVANEFYSRERDEWYQIRSLQEAFRKI